MGTRGQAVGIDETRTSRVPMLRTARAGVTDFRKPHGLDSHTREHELVEARKIPLNADSLSGMRSASTILPGSPTVRRARILFLVIVFATVQVLGAVAVHACHHGASSSAAAAHHCGCGRANDHSRAQLSEAPAAAKCCSIQQSQLEPKLDTRAPEPEPGSVSAGAVIRLPVGWSIDRDQLEARPLRSGTDRPIFLRNCSYLI
jgi:hypothetical protein